MSTDLTKEAQVWIPAERLGQIEVREYVHGDQARQIISISEADLKLPTLVGGFVARNPDNYADQWYIARAYFNKHYRIPTECRHLPLQAEWCPKCQQSMPAGQALHTDHCPAADLTDLGSVSKDTR